MARLYIPFLLLLAVPLLAAVLPISAYAQSDCENQICQCETQICVIIHNTITVFNRIVTILFILESATFIYGAITKVISPPNIKQQTAASQYMTWSIIAMAATVGAWGFAQLLIRYFGIGGASIPTEPGPIF